MKILVTDYAWNDLGIEHEVLKGLGASLVVAQTGAEDELVYLSEDVDGILTNWKRVARRVIDNSARCKAIVRYGVGLDNIDVHHATEIGIVVANVPAYCVEEVSDHALALLPALGRKVALYDRATKTGVYDVKAGPPLYRLRGKTLGIVGFGKIGRMVYRKAKAFGMRVVVSSRDGRPGATPQAHEEVGRVSFRDLLQQSDYISVHVPLTQDTRHLFKLEAFQRMKPTAFIINTARDDIIDPEALLKALDDGLIAGAGLDVLGIEPPGPGDALMLHPKTIITPHAAFISEESLRDLRVTASSEMLAILSGRMPEFLGQSEGS